MAIAEAKPAGLVLFMGPSRYGLTGGPRPMKFMLRGFERTYHGARMKVICILCGRGRLNWKKRRTGVNSHKIDRKSTRLNSSHLVISYAVFCLKKKKLT